MEGTDLVPTARDQTILPASPAFAWLPCSVFLFIKYKSTQSQNRYCNTAKAKEKGKQNYQGIREPLEEAQWTWWIQLKLEVPSWINPNSLEEECRAKPCWVRPRKAHLVQQHLLDHRGQPGTPEKMHKDMKAADYHHSCTPQQLGFGVKWPLEMELPPSIHSWQPLFNLTSMKLLNAL